MKFIIVLTIFTSLITLSSAFSIVNNVKFDLQAISTKFDDISHELNKFGEHITYLNDFRNIESQVDQTATALKTKTIMLNNLSGKMSREELRTILSLYKALRVSISKTMMLFISKKPIVLKVDVNPTQNIYPVSQTKDKLVSLMHLISDFEKAMENLLPYDQDLSRSFYTMKGEILFAFLRAIGAYRHN